MSANRQTPAARFLALTTILGLIFAFLLTPTLGETPNTYQTSRFASEESVDDSVPKYAQSAEEAGFRLRRKQVGDEGRGWVRLGRRQDEEGSKGVDELSDKVSVDPVFLLLIVRIGSKQNEVDLLISVTHLVNRNLNLPQQTQ
jgi:hypothetical protein